MTDETTGEKVKDRLLEWGFSIAQIAHEMGSYEQKLNSKLKAKDPGINFLMEVAKAAKKSLWELIDAPEQPTKSTKIGETDTPYGNKGLYEKLLTCMENKEQLYKDLVNAQRENLQLLKEQNQAKVK